MSTGHEFEAPREQHFEVLSHILTIQIKKYTRTDHEPALGLVVTRLCLQQEVAGSKLRRSNFFAKQKKEGELQCMATSATPILLVGPCHHVSEAGTSGGTQSPRQQGWDPDVGTHWWDNGAKSTTRDPLVGP